MQVTLVPVAREEAGQVYELMLQSFVSEERRDEKGFYAALENAAYKLYHIAADGKISGFIGLWEVCGGAFVEHIAISPDCRGSGMGSAAMKAVQQRYGSVVLEIEPPTGGDRLRRYNFYAALGFKLNDVEYFQPPYRPGDAPVAMKLLSWPDALPDCKSAVNAIYSTVYGIKSAEGEE